MSSRGRAIAGGLLAGLGEGMLLKAQNVRETIEAEQLAARARAREFRDRYFRKKEIEAAQGFRKKEIEEEQDFRTGLLTQKQKGDMELQLQRDKFLSPGSTTQSVVEDNAIIKGIIGMYTKSTGDIINPTETNYAKVTAKLRQIGEEDLAKRFDALKGETKAIDTNSDNWATAAGQAEKQASDKAGIWRSNKKDFKNWNGSKAAFIWAKTMEIYKELEGGQGGAAADRYKTKEDVGEAYTQGRITRAQAEQILKEQFGET